MASIFDYSKDKPSRGNPTGGTARAKAPVNILADPQLQQQTAQASTEFQDLAVNGNIPANPVNAGTVLSLTGNGQVNASVSTESIRQMAHEPVKANIKRGTITAQDYINKALEAENINRSTQGLPPMTEQESAAKAQKDEGFWSKLGLDGKTALILGASLVGAYKFRSTPQYNQAFMGAYENAQQRKFAGEAAEADRKYKTQEAQKQRDFTSGENQVDRATKTGLSQYDADQAAYRGDAQNASAEYIAQMNNAADMDRTKMTLSAKDGKKEDQVPKMSFEDAVKYSTPLIENKFGGDKVKAKDASANVAAQFRQIREGGLEDIAKVTGMQNLKQIQGITQMDDSTLIQYLISNLPTKQESSWLPWRDSKTVLNN